MGAWLQFVFVSKRTFSSNVLLLEFVSLLSLFPPPPPLLQILHPTNREANDVQTEWKRS